MLKLDAASFERGCHGGEDGEQFIGFAQQRFDEFGGNVAIIAQQFQPKLRLVRLVEQALNLGAKLGVGTGARGSRACAATDVPERNNCFPSTRTSSRAFGSATKQRMIADA